MKQLTALSLLMVVFWPAITSAGPGDTTLIQTFTFDSIVTRRAVFAFPGKDGARYEKILMYYTLKCDSLTPHDKYPCGEWDYTTYTRVYHHTGRMDSVRLQSPDFKVNGASPRELAYSGSPTYSYYEYWPDEGKNVQIPLSDDHYLTFSGTDWVQVPAEALRDIDQEVTVAFWLNGDVFRQPMASTVLEGLDEQGKRVINLHLPYDNGVVYWDAGGHGDGLTDNISKAVSPSVYKGRWNHWVFTKNSRTGYQRIYLNGKLLQQGDKLFRDMKGIRTFRIGSNGNGDGRFYQGSLDDFALWNRELDSAAVENLWKSGAPASSDPSLLFYYDFNGPDGQRFADRSVHGNDGIPFGYPDTRSFGGRSYPDFKPRPGVALVRDSIPNPLLSVVRFADSLHPALPTDTMLVYSGYSYFFNGQGILVDSVAVPWAKTLVRKTRTHYSTPEEVIEPVEIARFITPYGKRLDLGLNGFTWIYDVTDYEPLLHGQVDLQAANGQELLDLRFLFIEGVPPRDVISVKNIWPEGSYTYKDLADNIMLTPSMVALSPDASTFMLRARISGHGHNGPYNCCEWDPKTHYFSVNGQEAFSWKIWRDCGMNPVYPQGGTWQFDRAGWCPGTFVDTYDFELTPLVSRGDRVLIDYSIQAYDPDNGEEGGNYEMAMQLVEYGPPNYRTDASLEDILAPGTRQEFRRLNPISLNPVIRIRNTGSDTLTSLRIEYGLTSAEKSHYLWQGKLGFMESADVILPKPSWMGMKEGEVFEARIFNPNGKKDPHPGNDRLTSVVPAPVVLPPVFIVHVRTQGFDRAADNAGSVYDQQGTIAWERTLYQDTTTYHDTVRLAPGAYHFTFTDKNEDGMIRHWWLYWEDPDKVGTNGELKILDAEGHEIMDLGYDWAEKRELEFFVGEPR